MIWQTLLYFCLCNLVSSIYISFHTLVKYRKCQANFDVPVFQRNVKVKIIVEQQLSTLITW